MSVVVLMEGDMVGLIVLFDVPVCVKGDMVGVSVLIWCNRSGWCSCIV